MVNMTYSSLIVVAFLGFFYVVDGVNNLIDYIGQGNTGRPGVELQIQQI